MAIKVETTDGAMVELGASVWLNDVLQPRGCTKPVKATLVCAGSIDSGLWWYIDFNDPPGVSNPKPWNKVYSTYETAMAAQKASSKYPTSDIEELTRRIVSMEASDKSVDIVLNGHDRRIADLEKQGQSVVRVQNELTGRTCQLEQAGSMERMNDLLRRIQDIERTMAHGQFGVRIEQLENADGCVRKRINSIEILISSLSTLASSVAGLVNRVDKLEADITSRPTSRP